METQQKTSSAPLFILYIVVTFILLILTSIPTTGIFLAFFIVPTSIPIYSAFGVGFTKTRFFSKCGWPLLIIQILLLFISAFISALSTKNSGDWRSDAPYIICSDGCISYYSFWDVFMTCLTTSAVITVLLHVSFYINYLKTLREEKKKEKKTIK
ncbi:hypothetical protein IJ768_01800 [Candidatus Saccharibacteria bacterium]|nr:hypothetical protein [Candidatus Saccharibacteria bacterium]